MAFSTPQRVHLNRSSDQRPLHRLGHGPLACTVVICLLKLVSPIPVAAQSSWTWLHAEYGDELLGQFGAAVTGVGDIDGDSLADFLVGAPRPQLGGGGCAFAYSGANGRLIYRLGCADSVDSFGASLAALGDVDGDNVPDFAVGAPYEFVTGSVYVFSGASGTVIRRLDGGLDSGMVGSRFGWSLAATGDMDGDGRGDLLVGAPFATGSGPTQSGSILLYSGATGSLLLRVDGSTPNGTFGTSVASIGDVDGDGKADIVAVDPAYFGSVLILSGSTGQEILRIQDASMTPGYDMVVVGVPDLDGDGTPDLLVGEPDFISGAGTGAAAVYSGRTGLPLRSHVGPYGLSRFGESIGAGGDLNGDSISDILVGAPRSDAGTAGFEGLAFAYSGIQDSLLLRVGGIDRQEGLGSSIAFAGDVNGDGRDDFIVGAPGARVRMTQLLAGAAIVFAYVDVVQARGFLTSGGGSLNLGAGQGQVCFQLEPVGGSFDPTQVVPSSLVLRRAGVDYVEEQSLASGSGQVADTDGNGTPEVTACFSRADLRDLFFDLPPGMSQVTASLEANTVAGLRARATMTLEISVPGVRTMTVAPNPMPGRGVLSFTTSKQGAVTVDLFDGSGRHVRQLAHEADAAAGPHDVAIDGRGKSGQNLASGVYFVKLTSPDGVFSGRVVLVR